MTGSTRRGFIAGGLGTAAGLVVASAAPAGAATTTEDDRLPADAAESMSAYIHDTRRGEVTLMIEGREVTVTDKKLVARLAHAFARAERS